MHCLYCDAGGKSEFVFMVSLLIQQLYREILAVAAVSASSASSNAISSSKKLRARGRRHHSG